MRYEKKPANIHTDRQTDKKERNKDKLRDRESERGGESKVRQEILSCPHYENLLFSF